MQQCLNKNQFGSQLPNGSNIFKIQFPDCLLYRNRQKLRMKGCYVHVEITPSAVALLEWPGRPCLVGSLPTPAPNKMDGNRNPAHFPTALAREPCTYCQATPNKQHNKQKCVTLQETGWNPIYPLFKQFFWTFKLLYFHYFPTIEQNNWKSNPHFFLFLMSREQYIKNSCIDLLNKTWKKGCFLVWTIQCHANNMQNRGLTFQKYWLLHDGILIFKTRRFFPTSMPASQCIGRVAPKWSQLMQSGR